MNDTIRPAMPHRQGAERRDTGGGIDTLLVALPTAREGMLEAEIEEEPTLAAARAQADGHGNSWYELQP